MRPQQSLMRLRWREGEQRLKHRPFNRLDCNDVNRGRTGWRAAEGTDIEVRRAAGMLRVMRVKMLRVQLPIKTGRADLDTKRNASGWHEPDRDVGSEQHERQQRTGRNL